EGPCAARILSMLARRAYRRPPTPHEIDALVGFFETGRRRRGFESGIELGLERVLVDPGFLFRIEHDPPDAKSGESYRISDLELASRLSFFLWSSIPDEPLLSIAEPGALHDSTVLDRE